MTDENTVNHDTNNTLINGQIENSLVSPSLKMMLEISTNSIIDRQICNVLRKHFLEHCSIAWRPVKIELVVNTELTEDFIRIKKKFEKFSDGNQAEFKENYAFLIENDSQISDICHHGYQCTETSYNVLGHSKGGIYVCKYADVCIRQASLRRTSEEIMTMKLLIFKIVVGKQTAALVRKGSKLQPIAPTPLFTSHCSVIPAKEMDDLERQFDQSQIFLYQFEGRETVKRPPHCLPYAVITLIQDGALWPINFDDLDTEPNILETDILQVIAQSDDSQLQNKLKENIELTKTPVQSTVDYTDKEETSSSLVDKSSSSLLNSEATPTTTTSDNTFSSTIINGTEVSSSSLITSNDYVSTTSPVPSVVSTNSIDIQPNSTILPPPPPPPPPPTSSSSSLSSSSSSSTSVTSPNAKTPTPTITSTIPSSHSIVAAPVAYRQQTGLLGAVPTAATIRSVPGSVYVTTPGLANGLTGPIIYNGLPVDALRSYQATTAAVAPLMFATHAGQTIQQQNLYAAQLSAAAQQQAAQLAATAATTQYPQQSLINGFPPGCMAVRTTNGGYFLISPTSGVPATMQSSTPASLAQQQQQQYISFNAAGQPTAAATRLPMAVIGGQSQQVVYQYAGQPTIQAAPTQYIQLPSNYAQQQQQQFSTNAVMQTANSITSQMYASQTPAQYIGAPQLATSNNVHSSSSNSSSMVPQSTIVGSSTTMSSQPMPTLISPQKQSAASATAAALQQQQQYQHVSYSQQQQSQQQSVNSAHGTNVYYAAIAQAQAQLTAQVQAQQQAVTAATLTQQQQQQQQQQLGLVSQVQYATQQGIGQPMYYATSSGQTIYQAGGQSYILAQAAPAAGTTTTTGAPAMYSAGPALHNSATQQQNQQQASQAQAQQQQIAYQIAATSVQPTTATYQLLNNASNGNITGQQQAALGAGVVAQQPAQLVQRSSVMPQVRHHPYRS